MKYIFFVLFGIISLLLVINAGNTATPTLEITKECKEMVPLFNVLPVNESFVTSMVRRESDDLIIGSTCGKKQICLFSFNHTNSQVKMLDSFDALWWDEPCVALGPKGDIYLASRRAYDKQFVFERLRERPHTPEKFRRRDSVPPPNLMNENVNGMPIMHYSPEGRLQAEIMLPDTLSKDGVGALVVCADGTMLCGLSAPGGQLFTISLETGKSRAYGDVVRIPERHHKRWISRSLMVGDDGRVYFAGYYAEMKDRNELGEDDAMGFILALDPQTGEIDELDVRLPAVIGRRRFASIDASVKLNDGSFLGGTSDGYIFQFNPRDRAVECFGKPLRQQNICGLAKGADGLVYGVGGEPAGLPRLFAFDPAERRMYLGTSPSGNPPELSNQSFGDIGAAVSTSDGTLICGERERRGFLLIYRPEK